MTFRQLTLMVIIFFLIVPMQIKKPKDVSHYDEYDLKLRKTLGKIVYLSNLLVVGFYFIACILFFTYAILKN